MQLIDSMFAMFKWYRKNCGGKWYKIHLIGSGGGMESEIVYWSRRLPANCNDIEILKTEDYKK